MPRGWAEATAQAAFIAWAQYAAKDRTDGAARLLRVFHCPNGEERDGRVGAKLKRMGVRPGIPDLLYLGRARGADGAHVAEGHVGWAWELKAAGRDLSAAQRAVLAELEDEGYLVGHGEDWPTAARSFVAFLGLPDRLAPGPAGEWPDIRLPGSAP